MAGANKRSASTKKKPRPKAAKGQTSSLLRPVPLYEFSVGGIAGHVRLSDPGRGIAFAGATEGKSLPTPCQEVLSLRHYLRRAECGLLAPREICPCDAKTESTGAAFTYDKAKGWPVSATARYELLPAGGVDATFAFTFAQPIRGFEAAVETLMPKAQPTVYMHSGGSWVRAAAGPRAQRFYPRNVGAAELIADGRWEGLRQAGMSLAVDPNGYDYPMAVVRDERTGWALAYMALTEECTSVWVNGAERSIGLGLIGGDVKSRSSATCRLRVVLCLADELNDALPYYREFVQEARAKRK